MLAATSPELNNAFTRLYPRVVHLTYPFLLKEVTYFHETKGDPARDKIPCLRL